MKTTLRYLVLVIAVTIFPVALQAQTGVAGADSIPFIRAKLIADKYTFSDGGTREIKIRDDGSKLVKDRAKPIIRDAGNGLLTIITGIGFGSSDEVNFKVAGTVICTDGQPDWNVDLFCEGFQEKTRERVKTDDGWTVETETTENYYWEKDATGLLREGVDTICYFLIVMNPREDSLLKPMTDYYFLPVKEQETGKKSTMAQFMAASFTPADYGISGIFRGQPFSIITDGRQRKSWVFYNNQYLLMYQDDDLMPVSKKDRIVPYILIKNMESGLQRGDFSRLAMLCNYLNLKLGTGVY